MKISSKSIEIRSILAVDRLLFKYHSQIQGLRSYRLEISWPYWRHLWLKVCEARKCLYQRQLSWNLRQTVVSWSPLQAFMDASACRNCRLSVGLISLTRSQFVIAWHLLTKHRCCDYRTLAWRQADSSQHPWNFWYNSVMLNIIRIARDDFP